MRNIFRSALVLFVFLLCAGCNRDGPLLIDRPIKEVSTEIEKEAPTLMAENNVKGLSIIVIRNGRVSISKSYGFANTETNRIIDEHTVFRAASLGKPIFAYIVVSLAKQGKINLDKPLYSYLNEEVVNGDLGSKLITARMVLSHTTGLPNLDGTNSGPTFIFSPGKEFKYSGHAYMYLQKVVEAITGKDLDELAHEIVFRSLKMKNSSFVWLDKYRGVVSESYDSSGMPYTSKEKPDKAKAAWSLFTTIKDYSRFVSYTIEKSNISGSVAEEMLKTNVDVAEGVKWGLGWGLQNTTPNQSFWHWGSMAGFRHYIVGYPTEKMAVIVMANSEKSFKMVDNLMAIAIGGSYPSYDWF